MDQKQIANTIELTPKQIVAELDKYIVGQDDAKKAVAVAIRNRFRRRLVSEDIRDEIYPKNIIMIGPTGCGKTEIARRLSKLTGAPFVKVEATKYTEVGYVGRDVESMIRDLVNTSVNLVKKEFREAVEDKAKKNTEEKLLDLLLPSSKEPKKKHEEEKQESPISNLQDMLKAFASGLSQAGLDIQTGMNVEQNVSKQDSSKSVRDENRSEINRENDQKTSQNSSSMDSPEDTPENIGRSERVREIIRKKLINKELEDREVEVTIKVPPSPMVQVLSGSNMEDIDMQVQGMLGDILPKQSKKKKLTVAEARKVIMDEEIEKLIDHDKVQQEAINRAEQMGIIFLDELDKICGKGAMSSSGGPDVSREGVQRDLLPVVEGATVNTRHGPVKTDHILFIAAGAFHTSKPSDLIPELQGRFPIRVELQKLTEEDFRKILTSPQNSLTRQCTALMETEGVTLDFKDDGLDELARIAFMVNEQTENIGARRLHTIMEKLLEDISFNAPDLKGNEKKISITKEFVQERLKSIAKDTDLSHYIL